MSHQNQQFPIESQAQVNVLFFGRPGDGKTVLACSLLEHLIGKGTNDLRGSVELLNVSRDLTAALEEMKGCQWAAKSAPCPIASPAEQTVLHYNGFRIAINSLPGEVLRENGALNLDYLRQNIGPNDVVCHVINAWRYEADIARRGLFGFVSHLQQDRLGHNLLTAVTVACEQLFGFAASVLQRHKHEYRVLEACKDAIIRWEPPNLKGAPEFAATLPEGCPFDQQDLFRALRTFAKQAVKKDMDLLTMRQLLQYRPNSLVVLTRIDLLPVIPGVTMADFNAIFDEAFGTHDHHMSQRIAAPTVRLNYCPDGHESPVQIADLDTSGGKALWASIQHRLDRVKQSLQAPRPASPHVVSSPPTKPRPPVVRSILIGLAFIILTLSMKDSLSPTWWAIGAAAAMGLIIWLNVHVTRSQVAS